MASRIGVDVGGTFTDLITYDDATGDVRVVKEPTTPWAPEEGVVEAVRGGVPEQLLRAAAFFMHGTTIGLNALLERRGGSVGLLATRGFRDVLEIGRGDRADPYDLFWRRPEPLVPRELRVPVTERVLADCAHAARSCFGRWTVKGRLRENDTWSMPCLNLGSVTPAPPRTPASRSISIISSQPSFMPRFSAAMEG